MVPYRSICERLFKIYYEECVLGVSSGRKLIIAESYEKRNGKKGTVCIVETEKGVEFVTVKGNTISGPFESVMPLYRPIPATTDIKEECGRFLEILNKNRDCICNKSAYSKVKQYVNRIFTSGESIADGFLVKNGVNCGILNVRGEAIVPVTYTDIEHVSFILRNDSAVECGNSFLNKTNLFVCRKKVADHTLTDVYDVNGQCIFKDLTSFSIAEEVTTRESVCTGGEYPDYEMETTEIKRIRIEYDIFWEEFTVDMLIGKDGCSPTEHGPFGTVNSEADMIHCEFSEMPEESVPLMSAVLYAMRGYGKFADEDQAYKYLWFILHDFIWNELGLHELDMSVRSHNCIHRAGIETVGQLLDYPDDKLSEIRNMGRKNVAEVLAIKKEFLGFFRMNEQE